MELNRDQIIKALECWTSEYGCKGCPFIEQGCFDCGHIPIEISQSILSIIKELTVEVEALRGAANSYKMHYENVKADTVRKMQKRLKEEPIKVGLPLRGLRGRAAVEEYADELILQIGEIINKVAEEMLKEN